MICINLYLHGICVRAKQFAAALEYRWNLNRHDYAIYMSINDAGYIHVANAAAHHSTQLNSVKFNVFFIFCNSYNLFSFFALSVACIFSTRSNNSLLYLIWFYISLFASSHKFFTIHIQLNATDENHGYHILFNAFSNNYSPINVFQCSLSPRPYERYERERVLKSHNERQLYELISMLTLTLNSYIA